MVWFNKWRQGIHIFGGLCQNAVEEVSHEEHKSQSVQFHRSQIEWENQLQPILEKSVYWLKSGTHGLDWYVVRQLQQNNQKRVIEPSNSWEKEKQISSCSCHCLWKT